MTERKRGPYHHGAGKQIVDALKEHGELTVAQIKAKCELAEKCYLQRLLWAMVRRGKLVKEGMRLKAKYRLPEGA